MVRFWKILEISSFAVGMIAFLYAVALSQHWFYTAPLVPLPKVAKVEQFSAHGKTVYITSQEQHELNVAFAIAFVGVGLSGWIEVYKQPFSKRRSQETHDDEGPS
jgi:hypothetical protein